MQINIPKVRKYWAISFWLFLGWSILNIVVRAWNRSGALEESIGEFIGSATVMIITYTCAYKGKGVRSLVYIMTVSSISIFGEITHSPASYDFIGMSLKAFFWFTSYRLLLVNAIIGCKIQNEIYSKDNDLSESCNIV